MSREKAGKPGTPAGTATGSRSKINRIAAAMTHAVFVLAIALTFMRGGEPQATVKEAGLRTDAPAEKAETARLQQVPEPEKPTSGLPDGLREEEDDGDAAGEMDEQPSGEEFELAQNSRRSRRERRRERERQQEEAAPPELAQPLPTPQRSARDQARANRLMARLVAAYPDFLTGHDDNNLIWRDGSRMGFDDGVEKSFQERLERPDVEDQFAISYPPGEMLSDPEPDVDPGRFRNAAFFTKMYGDCRRRGGEVQKKLVDVVWLPKHGARKIRITPVNSIAERLQRISDELDALPDEFMKYLRPTAGTYNCRDIANTSRFSAHGFGIAIDLNTAFGDYWEWRGRRSAEMLPYRNRIPNEIVAIFEKHGFIWGGKWHHFDTAHFEYRPELLVADEEAVTGETAVPMPVKQPRNLN
jgi:hypothetical protein